MAYSPDHVRTMTGLQATRIPCSKPSLHMPVHVSRADFMFLTDGFRMIAWTPIWSTGMALSMMSCTSSPGMATGLSLSQDMTAAFSTMDASVGHTIASGRPSEAARRHAMSADSKTRPNPASATASAAARNISGSKESFLTHTREKKGHSERIPVRHEMRSARASEGRISDTQSAMNGSVMVSQVRELLSVHTGHVGRARAPHQHYVRSGQHRRQRRFGLPHGCLAGVFEILLPAA